MLETWQILLLFSQLNESQRYHYEVIPEGKYIQQYLKKNNLKPQSKTHK